MLPPLLLKEKTTNVGLSEQQNDTFHSSSKVRVECTVVLKPVRAQHINQTTSQELPTVIKLATFPHLLTILLCAERILLVRLEVGGGGAPELSVAASIRDAGVVRLPLVDKGKHAGLTT